MSFNIAGASQHASLVIYDISGRLTRTIFEGAADRGTHIYSWDGVRDDGGMSPNGVYLILLRVDGKATDANRIVLLR